MNLFDRHLTFINRKRGKKLFASLELAQRTSHWCEDIFVRRYQLLSWLPIKKEGGAGETLKISHMMRDGQILPKISAPLHLRKPFRSILYFQLDPFRWALALNPTLMHILPKQILALPVCLIFSIHPNLCTFFKSFPLIHEHFFWFWPLINEILVYFFSWHFLFVNTFSSLSSTLFPHPLFSSLSARLFISLHWKSDPSSPLSLFPNLILV